MEPPPIYVTENGVSERGAIDLDDIHRTHFYENYINQGLKGTGKKCFYEQMNDYFQEM